MNGPSRKKSHWWTCFESHSGEMISPKLFWPNMSFRQLLVDISRKAEVFEGRPVVQTFEEAFTWPIYPHHCPDCLLLSIMTACAFLIIFSNYESTYGFDVEFPGRLERIASAASNTASVWLVDNRPQCRASEVWEITMLVSIIFTKRRKSKRVTNLLEAIVFDMGVSMHPDSSLPRRASLHLAQFCSKLGHSNSVAELLRILLIPTMSCVELVSILRLLFMG